MKQKKKICLKIAPVVWTFSLCDLWFHFEVDPPRQGYVMRKNKGRIVFAHSVAWVWESSLSSRMHAWGRGKEKRLILFFFFKGSKQFVLLLMSALSPFLSFLILILFCWVLAWGECVFPHTERRNEMQQQNTPIRHKEKFQRWNGKSMEIKPSKRIHFRAELLLFFIVFATPLVTCPQLESIVK